MAAAKRFCALLVAVCSVALLPVLSLLEELRNSSRYTTEPLAEYDFIIVGGGTAGCLIAAELAKANASWTVLLLEAGMGVRDGALTEQTIPGGAVDNLALENIDWKYRVEQQTVPLRGNSAGLEGSFSGRGRSFPIPRGKGLGGSNELNYMLHVRGTAGDYDAWEAATGDPRWGAASMSRAEHVYEEAIAFASKAEPADGSTSHALGVAESWVAAAAQSRHGGTPSYNTAGGRDGGFHYEHAVRNGVRESTARQFLLPLLDGKSAAPNLHVMVSTHVQRLILSTEDDEGAAPKAVGVEMRQSECTVPEVSVPVLGTLLRARPCLWNGGRAPAERSTVVRASKEVVLSAGAYESPHLLLKSGVGGREELRAADVPVRVHLPGVGKHLQDHPIIGLKYRLGDASGSWLPLVTVTKLWLAFPSLVWGYFGQGKGALASSGCDIGYFGASNASYSGRPDLQMHGMVTAGDRGLFEGFLHYGRAFTGQVGEPSDYSSLFAQGLLIAPTLLHAAAEGSVGLNPAHKASGYDGPPTIRYEAFGDDDDVRRLTEGIRRLQEIMRQPSMARLKPTLLHARDLAAELGEDTDAYWAQYIRRFGFVVYHPTGTCRMGRAGEPSAVVDPSLRVLGVRGLRVADASIMPDITSGNTQVPTAAIAVQAVALLREEHGSK